MKKIINLKNEKFKFTKIYIIITIFAIFLSALYINKQYSSLVQKNKTISELNKKIEKQEKLNKELMDKKEYKNSPENIEKIAREKLGMVKSNEIIFYDTNK